MSDLKNSSDNARWLSTYGVLIAGSILKHFNVQLPPEKITQALQDNQNLYFHLLCVPLKNVLNGLILGQAEDYRLYIQKVLIDYLVSGADASSADANEEEDDTQDLKNKIEEARLQVIKVGEAFDACVLSHDLVIASSQRQLIDLHTTWSATNMTISSEQREALDVCMTPFVQKIEDLRTSFCAYRSQFYDLILHVRALINNVPHYQSDHNKNEKNIEYLRFDSTLGEISTAR